MKLPFQYIHRICGPNATYQNVVSVYNSKHREINSVKLRPKAMSARREILKMLKHDLNLFVESIESSQNSAP